MTQLTTCNNDALGDNTSIEVIGHKEKTPFSFSSDGPIGPPRVDIKYSDTGIEAFWLDQQQTDALIDALIQARQSIWGQRRQWVTIATWSEPESGVAVFGPYTSWSEARIDHFRIEPQFYNEGILPKDVEFRTQFLRPKEWI